jgi:hypothetical protein
LTQIFSSPLHGYSVSYPEGWTSRAATEPWTASTFPQNFFDPQVDVLHDPTLESDLFLILASQPIGDSTPEDWVAEQLATPDQGCDTTEPITVDGGIGQIGCTLAVVTSAGRGYWIQLYTGDAAPAIYDRAWFEEVLATVQQRAVLVFHHYLGLSISEVATRTGLPVGTVKSRLHHATRALRASLDADTRANPPSQEQLA